MAISSHPEIYEESASLLFFTRSMQRIMYACGVQDFNISDLTETKPKRSQRMLSGLINFFRFENERADWYQQLKAESEALKEEHLHLISKNDEILTKINNIKAKREEGKSEQLELERQVEEVTKKVSDYHLLQKSEQKYIDNKKTMIAEKKQSLAALKNQSASLREECDKLSRKIVQSPERMKSEDERKRQQLVALRRTKEERIQRHLELRDQYEKRLEEATHCAEGIRLITAVSEDIEKEREVCGEIKVVQDETQARKDILHDLTAREQQMKLKLTTKQDKMDKLALQQQNRVACLRQSIDSLESEKAGEQQQHEKFVGECHALLTTSTRTLTELDQQLTSMRTVYSQTLEKLDEYHSSLGSAWEQVKGKMEASALV